jgi:colanic acid/amylovoran biosynthesis protein
VNTDKMSQYLALVDSADCVVATGGGYLTDVFESHAARVLSLLGLAQHAGLPTFLFGQGLGPLQSPLLLGLCRQVFPELTVLGLREGKASLPLALSLGAASDRVAVTGDDAIELARSRVPQSLGNNIGVNLRVASYSQVGEDLLGRVRDVLHRVRAKHEVQLVPIPISHHVEDSDIATLEFLVGPGDENIASLDTPEKVILNVGKCRIVVTGSYHAGVFGLSQGIPVVGLAKSPYYQDKFAGLANQFKGGCQVVAMHEQNFPELLESAMEEAWQAAPVTRDMLLAQAEAQVQASRQAWEKLKQTMVGR